MIPRTARLSEHLFSCGRHSDTLLPGDPAAPRSTGPLMGCKPLPRGHGLGVRSHELEGPGVVCRPSVLLRCMGVCNTKAPKSRILPKTAAQLSCNCRFAALPPSHLIGSAIVRVCRSRYVVGSCITSQRSLARSSDEPSQVPAGQESSLHPDRGTASGGNDGRPPFRPFGIQGHHRRCLTMTWKRPLCSLPTSSIRPRSRLPAAGPR